MSAPSPRPLHAILPRCGAGQALVVKPDGEPARTVFYFPGCGSERVRSEVSMAALYVLLSTGTQVVLPPPFLCCGFPSHANARAAVHARTVLRDTILFSQIREMFGYLAFDACVVTCGTCREGLHHMGADRLFGGRVVDVARLRHRARAQASRAATTTSTTPPATTRSTARPPRCW